MRNWRPSSQGWWWGMGALSREFTKGPTCSGFCSSPAVDHPPFSKHWRLRYVLHLQLGDFKIGDQRNPFVSRLAQSHHQARKTWLHSGFPNRLEGKHWFLHSDKAQARSQSHSSFTSVFRLEFPVTLFQLHVEPGSQMTTGSPGASELHCPHQVPPGQSSVCQSTRHSKHKGIN